MERLGETELGRLAVRYVNERQRSGQIVRLTAEANYRHLRSFVESFGNRPLTQLGHAAMQRWLEAMERHGYAALRGFARWCVRRRGA